MEDIIAELLNSKQKSKQDLGKRIQYELNSYWYSQDYVAEYADEIRNELQERIDELEDALNIVPKSYGKLRVV